MEWEHEADEESGVVSQVRGSSQAGRGPCHPRSRASQPLGNVGKHRAVHKLSPAQPTALSCCTETCWGYLHESE